MPPLRGNHPIVPIYCILSETDQHVMAFCRKYRLLTYGGTKDIMQINRLTSCLLLLGHPQPNNNH